MDYMVGDYNIRDLHSVMLSIIEEVDRVCSKYGIKYVLYAGTLLGAIRHEGFIPWDDDFDIIMTRENYDRFISVANNELSKDYIFECIENTEEYPYYFGKIKDVNTIFREKLTGSLNTCHGVYIDLFPMDYIDEKNYKIIAQLLGKINAARFYKLGIISGKKYCIAKPIPLKVINFLSTKIMKYKYSEKGDWLYCLAMPSPGIIPLHKSFFENTKRVKFEHLSLPIPCEYDIYLRAFYGDYLKFPPVEKRKPGHEIIEVKL